MKQAENFPKKRSGGHSFPRIVPGLRCSLDAGATRIASSLPAVPWPSTRLSRLGHTEPSQWPASLLRSRRGGDPGEVILLGSSCDQGGGIFNPVKVSIFIDLEGLDEAHVEGAAVKGGECFVIPVGNPCFVLPIALDLRALWELVDECGSEAADILAIVLGEINLVAGDDLRAVDTQDIWEIGIPAQGDGNFSGACGSVHVFCLSYWTFRASPGGSRRAFPADEKNLAHTFLCVHNYFTPDRIIFSGNDQRIFAEKEHL